VIIKIFLGFIFIALAETLNGIFRVKILYKKLGVQKAKIVSFLLGSSIVFILNLILVPWLSPKTISDALIIGFAWMSLMIIYDIYVGKVLFKLSWKKILEDFNIFHGNLLGVGIGLILLLPVSIFLVVIQ
jgi:hypothetical protein